MAIIGGAVLTPAMGAVSTASSIQLAMIVPLVCFAVVGWLAWVSRDDNLTAVTDRREAAEVENVATVADRHQSRNTDA